MTVETVTHTAPMLHVGNVVHYVLPEKCRGAGACRPAIVLQGGSPPDVEVHMLPDDWPALSGSLSIYQRPQFDRDGKPGTWHNSRECPHGR